MKKEFDEKSIQNELEGGSAFFKQPEPKDTVPEDSENADHLKTEVSEIDLATEVNINYEEMLEEVRKAVKEFGKEAATHRFTKQEKQEISRIIFTYSTKGIRTSENEISRIAINFLIRDHKQNQNDSILDTILRKLNS